MSDTSNSPNPKSHITDKTSLSLLQRAKAHDQQAWERLVDLYSPLIVHWSRRSGMSDSDAADVLQEVFAAVAKNLNGFQRDRPGDTFRGWLRVITRNQIRMHIRKRAGKAEAAGGTEAQVRIECLAENTTAPNSPSDTEEQGEFYKRAMELIRNEFEDRTWKAFVQTTLESRSSIDVAADLGMSAGAVRQAKYKVLRRLRTEFGEIIE